MELKVAGKALKRGFRFFIARNQNKITSKKISEAVTIAKGGEGVVSCREEDGVVKMKILVKKSDLKKLIEMMSTDAGSNAGEAYRLSSSVPPSSSVEQQLNLLCKKHQCKANAVPVRMNRHKSWSPALQSILEEI